MKLNKKALAKWHNYKPHKENGKIIQYYNSDPLRELKDDNGHNVDIAFVWSGRDRGKSFEISSKAIQRALETDGKEQFAYVRRYRDDINAYMVTNYLEDKIQFLKDITENKYDCFIVYQSKIYVGHTGEDGKAVKDFVIGHIFALNIATRYKSQQFPYIKTMIFEEVFADVYIPHETEVLMNLISTIKRHKEGFIIFMISNTISRVNPYINDFGMVQMYRQKEGTLELYNMSTTEFDDNGNRIYYLIACEYLANALSEEEVKSKENRINRLLNRKIHDSTLSNKWDEKGRYPIIRNHFITKYPCYYSMIFENKGFRYLARLYQVPSNIQELYIADIEEENKLQPSDTEMLVVYIERKTTPYQENQRVITDCPIVKPYFTRGIHILDKQEEEILKRIEIGHCFYSDNLLANEFVQNYKELVRLNAI